MMRFMNRYQQCGKFIAWLVLLLLLTETAASAGVLDRMRARFGFGSSLGGATCGSTCGAGVCGGTPSCGCGGTSAPQAGIFRRLANQLRGGAGGGCGGGGGLLNGCGTSSCALPGPSPTNCFSPAPVHTCSSPVISHSAPICSAPVYAQPVCSAPIVSAPVVTPISTISHCIAPERIISERIISERVIGPAIEISPRIAPTRVCCPCPSRTIAPARIVRRSCAPRYSAPRSYSRSPRPYRRPCPQRCQQPCAAPCGGCGGCGGNMCDPHPRIRPPFEQRRPFLNRLRGLFSAGGPAIESKPSRPASESVAFTPSAQLVNSKINKRSTKSESKQPAKIAFIPGRVVPSTTSSFSQAERLTITARVRATPSPNQIRIATGK